MLIALALLCAAGVAHFTGPCARPDTTRQALVEPTRGAARDHAEDGLSKSTSRADDARTSEREEVSFIPIAHWGSDATRVVVVERASGARVPGASVSYLAADARIEQFALDGSGWIGPDAEATVRDRGRTVLADARGEVEIPPSGEAWLVCARSNDLFGWVRIPAHGAGEEPILLDRQRDLVVHVADDLGRACPGIRVGLCRWPQTQNDWENDTDASGNVTIQNFVSVERQAFLEEEHAVEVHAEFPAQPAIAQWIDPNEPPSEPVQLVLPAFGRLRVQLVDQLGLPVHLPGRVLIDTFPSAGVVRDPKQGRLCATDPFHDADTVDAPVPIDTELDVHIELEVGGHGSAHVTGPRARGDVVSARIALDERSALFSGRIVDDHGTPVARSIFQLQKFSFDNGAPRNWTADTLRTDAEGRFLTSRPDDMAWIVERAPVRERRAAILDLRSLPRSTAHDFGDVRLSAIPPLVHGRIEDEDRRPIAGGYVHVLFKRAPTDPIQETLGADATDPNGEFVIFGPCADGAYSLWAASDGERHRSPPAAESFSCREPPHEHMLRLEALGAVEGYALLDEGRSRNDFELRIASNGDDYRADGSIVGGGYRFQIRGVPRGVHALSLIERQTNAKLLELDGIAVRPGEITHDPRLEPLDLRHAFRHPAATDVVTPVVDTAGRSVSFGTVWFWEDAESASRDRWSNGRVHVPASGVIAVEVVAPGYRIQRVERSELQQPIVLGTACDVEIVLDGFQSLADAGLKATVMLRPLGESRMRHAMRELLDGATPNVLVDEFGVAHFHLAMAGQFELGLKVIQPDSASAGAVKDAWTIRADASSASVEVLDRDGRQRFDARMDAGELRDLLDSLRGIKRAR
jgi:hypothetical protein